MNVYLMTTVASSETISVYGRAFAIVDKYVCARCVRE